MGEKGKSSRKDSRNGKRRKIRSKARRSGSHEPRTSLSQRLESILRHIRSGDLQKLERAVKKLVRDHPDGLAAQTGNGWTALHHACNLNDTAAARLLLSAGANAGLLDELGNSAAHIAARHANLELLEELMYADLPADMDHRNSQGYTPKQIAVEALQAAELRGAHAEALRAAALRQREEAEWHARLCDEINDDGNVAGSWWGDDWGSSESGHASERRQPGEDGAEDEEEYRARVVREMNERRAKSHFSAISSAVPQPSGRCKRPRADRDTATEEKEQHWRQVLEEEVEKDRRWRQRVAQVKTTAELRADYERKWQSFLLEDKAPGSVTHDNIPWIAPPSKGRRVIGEVALAGVCPTDPSARKKRLRMELLRWHPDKFLARFSCCIRPGELDKVLASVTQTSAVLTELGT